MKTFTHFLFLLVFLFGASTDVAAAVVKNPPAAALSIAQNQATTLGLADLSVEQFLKLRPRDVREMTGERLGLKGAIALKAAQKAVKKELRQTNQIRERDQLVALILVIVVGWMGVHRFYLGYYGIGVTQLLTFGFCGIWTLVDMVMILTGDLQPKNGYYSEKI